MPQNRAFPKQFHPEGYMSQFFITAQLLRYTPFGAERDRRAMTIRCQDSKGPTLHFGQALRVSVRQ
jgi:hypothetical protein